MIAEEGDIDVVATPVSKPGPTVATLVALTLRPAGTTADALDIRDQPIAQQEDGSLTLLPHDAEIDGEAIRLEGGEPPHLAWWNQRGKTIRWPVRFARPGIYEISGD